MPSQSKYLMVPLLEDSEGPRGPHVDRRSKYKSGGPITLTSDMAELTVLPLIVDMAELIGTDRHQATVISPLAVAAEWDVARKDSNIAVDLTESIKGETVNHHQSSIDQTCV